MLVKKEYVDMVSKVSADDVERYINKNFDFATSLRIDIPDLSVKACLMTDDDNPLHQCDFYPQIFNYGYDGDLGDDWVVDKNGREVNLLELMQEQDEYESISEFLMNWFKENGYVFAGVKIMEHSGVSVEVFNINDERLKDWWVNAFFYMKESELKEYMGERELTSDMLNAESKVWKNLGEELEAWINGVLYAVTFESKWAYNAERFTSISDCAEFLASELNNAWDMANK